MFVTVAMSVIVSKCRMMHAELVGVSAVHLCIKLYVLGSMILWPAYRKINVDFMWPLRFTVWTNMAREVNEITEHLCSRNILTPQFPVPAVNTVFGASHLHLGSSQGLYLPYLGTRTVIVICYLNDTQTSYMLFVLDPF